MNAIVRALGFGTRLQPRTARLSVPFGSADRAAPHDLPLRDDHPACSAADEAGDLNGERAQVSVARARDRVAGGRKEPA
jgi:hypothetical protein